MTLRATFLWKNRHKAEVTGEKKKVVFFKDLIIVDDKCEGTSENAIPQASASLRSHPPALIFRNTLCYSHVPLQIPDNVASTFSPHKQSLF